MSVISRRRFLVYLASASAALVLTPVLGGCQQLAPQPFETGRQVPAPKGCKDLRALDPSGDC